MTFVAGNGCPGGPTGRLLKGIAISAKYMFAAQAPLAVPIRRLPISGKPTVRARSSVTLVIDAPVSTKANAACTFKRRSAYVGLRNRMHSSC